jgi:hypothetical protein
MTLSLAGGPTRGAGALVALSAGGSYSWQRWRLVEHSVFQHGGGLKPTRIIRVYQLVNNFSGMCMDVADGTANGGRVYQRGCLQHHPGDSDHPANRQLWKATRNYRGQHQLINVPGGKCLDIPGFQAVPGQRMQVWSCSEAWNQAFHLYRRY